MAMPFLSLRTATATSIAAVGLATGLACTLILDPDDAVERCGSTDDCSATGDNRYVAECRFDPENQLDSTEVDKVCVATFKPIGCDPSQYRNEQMPQEMSLYQSVVADAATLEHLALCADTPGVRGCRPEAGTGAAGCAEGLVLRMDGVCDVSDDPDTPYYGRGTFPETAMEGQDALDQFCRSFFCEDNWVCDTTDFTCVQCDPNEMFGQGGCGVVVSEGQPSCLYPPDLAAVCDGPDAVASEPVFGTCG